MYRQVNFLDLCFYNLQEGTFELVSNESAFEFFFFFGGGGDEMLEAPSLLGSTPMHPWACLDLVFLHNLSVDLVYL